MSAALTEAEALRDLDDQLYPDAHGPGRLDNARRLHTLWRKWAEEGGALLRRIIREDASIRSRPDVLQLRQEVALAEALIEQPPEMLLQGIEEARAGDVMPIEEVRRELRARHHE